MWKRSFGPLFHPVFPSVQYILFKTLFVVHFRCWVLLRFPFFLVPDFPFNASPVFLFSLVIFSSPWFPILSRTLLLAGSGFSVLHPPVVSISEAVAGFARAR